MEGFLCMYKKRSFLVKFKAILIFNIADVDGDKTIFG